MSLKVTIQSSIGAGQTKLTIEAEGNDAAQKAAKALEELTHK